MEGVMSVSLESVAQSIQEMQMMIERIRANQENDHARIEEHKKLMEPISQLPVKFDNLAEQIKGQNQRSDKFYDSIKGQLATQGTRHGERIGALEGNVSSQAAILEKLQKRSDGFDAFVDEQKTKGNKLLGGIFEKIVCFIIGAVLMFVLYQFGL